MTTTIKRLLIKLRVLKAPVPPVPTLEDRLFSFVQGGANALNMFRAAHSKMQESNQGLEDYRNVLGLEANRIASLDNKAAEEIAGNEKVMRHLEETGLVR